VNQSARTAFEAWKEADALARGAETRLAQAWDGYFKSRSTPPGRELVHEVAVLRLAANEKLSAAMQALGAKRGDGPSRPGIAPRDGPSSS
jgi:hypothetical protein